jgi:SAM-dependent methyltransferase
LACGRGQNGLWLVERGYRVLAVDLSAVALAAGQAEARRRRLADQIAFVQVELETWVVPTAAFDLIAVFQYRQQRLYPELRAGVRPGGLLAMSTHNVGYLDREPTANPAYLVQPGEWLDAFGDWELLYHNEGPTQSELIARRPRRPPVD